MNNRPIIASRILVSAVAVLCIVLLNIRTQSPDAGVRNNPFSPSPAAKAGGDKSTAEITDRLLVSKFEASRVESRNRPVAAVEPKSADSATADPTAVYRVGVNDIIRIDIRNARGGLSYVKVASDGRIDFPLAGDNLIVSGKTSTEIEELLKSGIKLFADPQIKVEVREFASHIISITGLVDQPGEQQIQRDALPFYVVRAGVVLNPRATSVRIIRAMSGNSTPYLLSDSILDNILVYPGDTVEFFDL